MSQGPSKNHFEPRSISDKEQAVQFRKHISYASAASPFYRDLFRQENIHAAELTINHIARLPCTTKDVIQNNERAFLCIPDNQIIEYVTTSGTLGTPVTFMLSEKDLLRLAHNEFLALACAGIESKDLVQIMVTLDKRFMAGMAYYLGARKLGCGIVRTGVESLAFQLDTIMRLQPTVLVAVPSFIVKLIAHAHATSIDLNETTVNRIVCIGEPIRRVDFSLNTLGRRIKDVWDVQLHSTYASTEMSTAFTECAAGKGGHHLPELIVTEILDPDGQPVAAGVPGELVVTPLGVEAMPLIRFKTGDICRKFEEPCDCGRTTMRLGPVEGRQQQMIKYKGTSLYPPALFDVLNGISAIDQYLVLLDKSSYDTDTICVEYCTRANTEKINELLKQAFKSYIRVVPEIRVISMEEMKQKTYDELSRKPIRLIDKRLVKN